MPENTNNTNNIQNELQKVNLSYDASQTSYRRQNKVIDLAAEDKVTTQTERRRLVSNSRDLERNFPAASWAINKHLDYVSTFNFQARTGDKDLDRDIENLIRWWSLPQNCDLSGRHTLPQLIRLAEHARTTDGDIFINKISNGRIQLIEEDKVHNVYGVNMKKLMGKPEEYIHGVRVNKNLRALSYVVAERVMGLGTNYEFRAELPAQFVYHLGYFKRYDQVRGISPIASAITSYQDVSEATELHLAKMKVAQYFGLKITRQSNEPLDNDDDAKSSPYSFDFGKGPQLLDLDEGDDANFMNASVGSENDFKNYLEIMLQLCLKSLDIPYTFYDVSGANYSSARQDLLQYELSAKAKREQLQSMLDNLTAWRLSMFVNDGVLKLPSNTKLGDIRWEWVPHSVPWIDPQKEISAYVEAIDNQLTSRSAVAKSQGKDWEDIVEQLQKEQYMINEKLGENKNED